MVPSTIALRPAAPADREFLFRLYASTREEELALLAWPPGMKEAFLRQQFEARTRDYESRSNAGESVIVLRDGQPVGQLWVDRSQDELRVLDVALMPGHQRSGLGTSLLTGLLNEARERNVPVRLHVFADNPARRLYERLGFSAVGPAGAYQEMECRP
jgi:ribosomal protein S18 acetylase RimI-like enzyme